MGKLNTTGYYSLNKRGVISFLENSRRESIMSFARRVRKNNPTKSTIIGAYSLKSHKGADMKAEAKGLGIGLVSLPPYCPHPIPIGRMWKNAENVMSTRLARHANDMRDIIKETFYQLTKNLNLFATRLDEFLASRFDYSSSCR